MLVFSDGKYNIPGTIASSIPRIHIQIVLSRKYEKRNVEKQFINN